jgi:hypothetical protein
MIVDELTLERVSRERRFDARTLEIARRLFIDKDPPRKVAKEFALIDKRIYAIRADVIDHVKKYELPDGWSEVVLRGPTDVVKAADALFKRRMKALSKLQSASSSGEL